MHEPASAERASTILIVDDDVASVHATRSALAPLGATIVFATAPDDALRIARERRPDLVLLDIQMPHVDGFEVCRRLQSALPQIPIIFLTHHDAPHYETKALAAGGIDFVVKPYSADVLQARVARALRSEQRTREAVQAEREHWQRIGETRVAEILASASDAFVTLDAEGRVVLMNQAACAMFAARAVDVVGQHGASVLPMDLLEMVSPGMEVRLLLERPDAGPLPVGISRSSLGHGASSLDTWVIRDLSARDEAERASRARLAAEATLRAKSLMLSYLAHEIANPLGAILGFGELLENDRAEPLSAKHAEHLAYMMTAARHLKALMRDVLDVNALESGRFEFATKPLDLERCLRDAARALTPLAAQYCIRLELASPAEALTVEADPMRMQQCLLNLISNAIKYNVAGGWVELSARRIGERALVAVRDGGLGMDEEQLAHLFEPYNRLGRKGSGSGIGLALTRQLLNGMGGSLNVESAPGTGSCFSFDLPLRAGA